MITRFKATARRILGPRWGTLFLQLVAYMSLGGLGALTDVVVFALLVKLGVFHVWANIVSVTCGIALSYTLNARITFRRTDRRLLRVTRFFIVGLLGLALSTVALDAMINHGLREMIAKLITLPVVALFQFVLNRQWTFRGMPPVEIEDLADEPVSAGPVR